MYNRAVYSFRSLTLFDQNESQSNGRWSMNYTYVSNRLKLQIVMSIKMILRREIERIEINYLLPLINTR